MKLQARLFYILIIFFFAIALNAQDLIVKTNGKRIFCQITKVDSTTIFYMRPRDNAEQKVERREVKKYFVAQKKAALAINTGSVPSLHYEALTLGLFAGRSMPVGRFAGKDLSKDHSGFALDGYMLGGNASYKIMDEFGFSFSYIYQVNRFNQRAMAEEFNKAFPNGAFTTNATIWRMKGFFLGFLVNLNIRGIHGLSLKIEVKGGLPRFYQPEIYTNGTINGQLVSIETKGKPVRAITFYSSGGLVYKLARNIAFTADLDFFYGTPYFTGQHKSNFGFLQKYTYEQPYRTVTPRLGLCVFLLHKKVY